jgi:predicted DNA-binding transcriptional regulator AlpA
MPPAARREAPRVSAAALNERDAAKYLGMSESWLRHNLLYNPEVVPQHLRCGAAVRYRVQDLDAFLEAALVRAAPQPLPEPPLPPGPRRRGRPRKHHPNGSTSDPAS